MVFYRVLELAVAHAPVRYRDLVADPQPKRTPPSPPVRESLLTDPWVIRIRGGWGGGRTGVSVHAPSTAGTAAPLPTRSSRCPGRSVLPLHPSERDHVCLNAVWRVADGEGVEVSVMEHL